MLSGEIFDTVLEAQVLTEARRTQYNQARLHSALGYRPRAPEAVCEVRITKPLIPHWMYHGYLVQAKWSGQLSVEQLQ